MLKLFMSGDMDELTDEQEQQRLPVSERRNAYQVLRTALDDERYRPVRELCAEVGEGDLAGYTVPPVTDWTIVSSLNINGTAAEQQRDVEIH
eukprot:scaffold81102_cov29-Prasinocladus_malaysianus.AAC.1